MHRNFGAFCEFWIFIQYYYSKLTKSREPSNALRYNPNFEYFAKVPKN